MKDDVQVCIDARLNMFTQYYQVPQNVQPEVDAFRDQLLAIGESSADAAAFEATFAQKNLNEQFTGLLMRCTAKPYQMTQEEKQKVREVKQQFAQENKGQLARDIVGDIADSVMMEVESEAISAKRKAMIDSGTMDEYTRASNAAEDVGWLAKGIGKLFGKGKKS